MLLRYDIIVITRQPIDIINPIYVTDSNTRANGVSSVGSISGDTS